MKMQKRMFRIGDLAEKLAVEKFVIRFWEKEFKVKTTRSDGGQRFYSQQDLEQFQRIKELLYSDGFTIAGAKKELEKLETSFSTGALKTTFDTTIQIDGSVKDELLMIKEKLRNLADQLHN